MNVTHGTPSSVSRERPPCTEKAVLDLMSQDVCSAEKRTLVGLDAHDDARALVRLIQCRRCSRPYRNPITLPCGRSLCRQCMPPSHQREHISYPDLPGRRIAYPCPFVECGQEHPASDCSVDVTLTKLMDSIAEVVAKHASLAGGTTTVTEEIAHEGGSAMLSEKPPMRPSVGGRLLATYLLAAQGELASDADLVYHHISDSAISEREMDMKLVAAMLEATQREVDCQVCYNLMLDPVTTTCGHTLCRKCLARVLDHSMYCPVCRRSLSIAPSLTLQPSNVVLVELLNALCPQAVAARAEAASLEEQPGLGELNVPLFICTSAFPGQPTFLRIFEPRYRLMLRRCLMGNREFGMLMYNRYHTPQGELGTVPFYEYGTMLRILHSQTLPDGTSLIETRGVYRFRVRAHGSCDGYSIGHVERFDDVPLADEERLEAEETSRPPAPDDSDVQAQISRMPTQDLLAVGREFVMRMQGRSASWLAQRVLDIYGQPPEDAALFPYWFASVLPISDEEKYKLMGTTTVRERLKITASWIRRMESQRWYQSNSCRIL